jgi:4-diphosphocytidyl-2-C-methyl-D-erythritol kinase
MNSLTLQTCAKINLCLRVLNRRADGFHNVDTVLHTVGIWDTLEFSDLEGDEIVLTVAGEETPADESNLCWRAARALREWAKLSRGVRLSLRKSIPVGAGLGGGSSDAAATLVGLSRLWGLGVPPEEMAALAAELGSDVSFFLRGGCAVARERGEKLEPLPSLSLPLVVVVPERRVPTKKAYAALQRGASLRRRRTLDRMTRRMLEAVQGQETGAVAAALHNDFEALDMVGVTEAREAKASLLEAGCLGAVLSGSGSAVFGIAPDAGAAGNIAVALRGRWPWVSTAPTVPAEESMIVTQEGEVAAPEGAGEQEGSP